MGKLLNRRASTRPGKRREPPTHRTDVPLSIDAGHGVAYRVLIVQSIEFNSHVEFDHDGRIVRVRAKDDARELVKYLAMAAEVVANHVVRAAAGWAREELQSALSHVAPFVDAATPTRSAVRLAFHNAGLLDGSGSDLYEPTLEALERARDALDAMPDDERRAMLNGWSIDRERPALADVQRAEDGDECRRVLALLLSDRHVSADHAYLTQLGSYRDRVCVAIQEGTSKADALRLLGEAVQLVRDAWPALVDEASMPDAARHRVPGMIRDGHTLDEAIAAVADASPLAFAMPGRVLFDGTTPLEPAVRRLLSTGDRTGVGTQILTEESIDRHGRAIRVGDVVVECDGGVIATRGEAGAGRVLAVAGAAVIYALGDGRGYTSATASDCYVVAANEKSGASRTPVTPQLGGGESDEARAATTAAA